MPKELHQGFRESGFESRRCLRMPRRKGSRAEKVSSPLVICTRRMRGKLQKNKVAGSSPAPLARQRVVQLDRTWRVSRYLVGAALCPCGVAQSGQMPKELQLPTLVVAGSNPAPAARWQGSLAVEHDRLFLHSCCPLCVAPLWRGGLHNRFVCRMSAVGIRATRRVTLPCSTAHLANAGRTTSRK